MKERWRDIPEYEGLYQASDHGRIRSRSRIIKARSGGKARREGKILKVIPVRSYYQVTLYKNGKPKNMRLPRLVALAWLPRPSTCRDRVRNKDGNNLNCRPENLEWVPVKKSLESKRTEEPVGAVRESPIQRVTGMSGFRWPEPRYSSF